MGGSKKKRGKRGHGGKNSRKQDDGTAMSRRELQDVVEARRQERKAAKQTANKFTVDQLLEKAEEYLDTYEYAMAQKFCQRALQMEPDNVRALETSGNLLAELGDGDGAMRCFGRAITVSPEDGFSKYMYMGQLHEGLKGLQFFQKGVELMIRERNGKTKEENGAASSSTDDRIPSSATNRDISRAYCSIAEIFLTDACFEENSDQRCKAALDEAIKEDPHNPEAHQLMASYWLSKEDNEQAKVSMARGLSLWQRTGEGGGATMEDETTSEPPISYDSRIGGVKILIELEMLEEAENALHSLLAEDDEVVQVWYMLGLVQCERGTDDCKPPGRYYLHKAKKLYFALQCDDDQVLQHISELLTSLGPGEGDEEDWMERKAREEEEEEDEEEEDIDSEASSDEEEEEEMEH